MQAANIQPEKIPGPHDSPTGVADLYDNENPKVVEGNPSVFEKPQEVVEKIEEVVEKPDEVVEKRDEVVEKPEEVVEESPEIIEQEESSENIEKTPEVVEGKADIVESPEIISVSKDSDESEKQMMTPNMLSERIKRPDKSIIEKNKYNYAIDSALYLKNKFSRTKKQQPVDKWNDEIIQKWRAKTLKTYTSILKLTNSKHTYKMHHRQLDKYRNTMNRILNEINKVKISGTKKNKK
jgi:hypothetical protein